MSKMSKFLWMLSVILVAMGSVTSAMLILSYFSEMSEVWANSSSIDRSAEEQKAMNKRWYLITGWGIFVIGSGLQTIWGLVDVLVKALRKNDPSKIDGIRHSLINAVFAAINWLTIALSEAGWIWFGWIDYEKYGRQRIILCIALFGLKILESCTWQLLKSKLEREWAEKGKMKEDECEEKEEKSETKEEKKKEEEGETKEEKKKKEEGETKEEKKKKEEGETKEEKKEEVMVEGNGSLE